MSFSETWMHRETVVQNEVSQKKEKNRYGILTHMCGINKNDKDDLICKAETEPQMWKTNILILWVKKKGWDGLGGWN